MSKTTPTLWMPVCAIALIFCACQPAETTNNIATGVPVTVNLPPGAARHVYNFNANPTSPTTLRFDSTIPGTPFTAEIIDSTGTVIAVISGDSMQTASLTLGPATGVYQVALSSTSSDVQGSVRLSIVDDVETAATAQATTAPTQCIITATHPGGVNMRSQPGLDHEILGVMQPDSSLHADARTSNGWYRVDNNGQGGWVSSDVVSASGMCADLPLQIIPAGERTNTIDGSQFVSVLNVNTNSAPYDAAAYYFEVADSSSGNFSDSVSYPDGDGTDRVLLAISGLRPGIGNERPFSITMECSGAGAENLRWGAPDNPALGCGSTAGITFTSEYNRQPLLVTLPIGASQSNVEYTLHAAPVAPDDAPVLGMGIDLNGGGQLSNMLSAPTGDNNDTIQMVMVNLAEQMPDNFRDLLISLECSGTGVENVRWGIVGGAALTCGSATTISMSHGDSVKNVLVTLPESSSESYISYTLRAVPIALPDTTQFNFGFDRDSGGLFNEALSYPYGDSSDTLVVNINNLTESPPTNFRNIRITLICSGAGIENLRWGTSNDLSLTCNMSMDIPFLYGLAGQSLVVMLPEGSLPTYAHYTLYATPLS
jgi:uncharacterized protein YraI